MRHTADRADRVAAIALALATDEHAGPRGALVALADRLDSLTGLAVTVGLPSGRGDPLGLRRAALGAIAIHRDTPAFARLSLAHALSVVAARQPVEVGGGARYHIWDFLVRRFERRLLDEGHPIDRVRAVLIHADRPRHADLVLGQLTGLSKRDDFRRLAAALKRARRIVPTGDHPPVDPQLLTHPAERRLHEAVARTRSALTSPADLAQLLAAGGDLPSAIDDLFTSVIVQAQDPQVRAARLALLASAAALGDDVLNWRELNCRTGV